MTRKRIRIPIEQLIELHRDPGQLDPFWIDWRCCLCGMRVGALDRTAALDAAADHLALDHAATGGVIRRRRNR